MRKIVLALAAVAAFGLAVPVVSAPAEAKHNKVMVIKKKHHANRGHHYGWYKQGHHRRHGATVTVR